MKNVLILLSAITLLFCPATAVLAAENDSLISSGDETEFITQTMRSEINNCQINLSADIPDEFGLDLYCDFMNSDTGDVYRLYALYKNEYMSFIFVPDGEYLIIDCAVYGDTTNEFPLTLPDDFIVSKDSQYTIKTALIKSDEVTDKIEERISGQSSSGYEAKTSDELDIREYSHKEPLPWRVIKKSKGLEADVTVDGISSFDGTIIIQVVKSGEVNEAEFIYSTDNGVSWSNNQLLASSFTVEKTGLTFHFPSDDISGRSSTWKAIYNEGDSIEFRAYSECNVTANVSKGAVINAYKNEVVYGDDVSLVLKVTNTGDTSSALFDYSLDGGRTFKGKSIPMTEDCVLSELPVVIRFTDLCGEYVVNDTFSVEIKGQKVKRDTTHVLYILAGIVLITAVLAYAWLLSFKEKDSEYSLNTYIPYKKAKGRTFK